METTHSPQPGATVADAAASPGLSREELAAVMPVLKHLFRRVGWDLDVLPPDESKWPGSERLFNVVLSAMGAAWQNSWKYLARLKDLDALRAQKLHQLGASLIQPPPYDLERSKLRAEGEARLNQQLLDLVHQDLTPTERARLFNSMGQRERAIRRQLERCYVAQAKSFKKKRKRPR